MKLVKNFVFAVFLVASIAVTTPAGDQNTPGYAPPPPPPATSTSDKYDSSDSNTDQTGGVTAETSDYLLFEALVALLSVY